MSLYNASRVLVDDEKGKKVLSMDGFRLFRMQYDLQQAKHCKELYDIAFDEVIVMLELVGTRWRHTGAVKQSIAGCVAEVVEEAFITLFDNNDFRAEKITAKEAQMYGLEKDYSFKVYIAGHENCEKKAAYFTMTTKPCTVPKKTASSRTEGEVITGCRRVSTAGVNSICVDDYLKSVGLLEQELTRTLRMAWYKAITEDSLAIGNAKSPVELANAAHALQSHTSFLEEQSNKILQYC